MELIKEMEIKVLNWEIMSWFCFSLRKTTPSYCLVKLSNLICLDEHKITVKLSSHLIITINHLIMFG
jgi:hypothetical protein